MNLKNNDITTIINVTCIINIIIIILITLIINITTMTHIITIEIVIHIIVMIYAEAIYKSSPNIILESFFDVNRNNLQFTYCISLLII